MSFKSCESRRIGCDAQLFLMVSLELKRQGVDAVAAAIDACHRTIYRGRSLGVLSAEDLAMLARPSMRLGR